MGVRDLEAAEPVDRGRHDREGDLDRLHQPAARHAAPHLEVGEAVRLAREPLGELGRAAHRLPEQDPGDRQRLLDERGDVGHRLLPGHRDLPARLADPPRDETKIGISASATTASFHSSRNIAITVAITVVTVDITDVAVEVRTLSTPPMSFEIRLCTSPVRVFVKNASDSRCRCRKTRGAQVVHDALADLRREVGLDDAEDAGDERDRDHPEHELGQQAQVDDHVLAVPSA